MADIYARMAATAQRMLAPTSAGGLGQGSVVLVQMTPAPAPAQPWDPPGAPVPMETLLHGAATGVSKELIGTPLGNGTAILASDKQVIVAPWDGDAAPQDVLMLDDAPHTVLRVDRIPPLGITAAVRLIVRG